MWCHNDGVKYDLKMIMISEILKIIKVHKDFFLWTTALDAIVILAHEQFMMNMQAWWISVYKLCFIYNYDAQLYSVTDNKVCMINRYVQVKK